jgi:hypothetical protein
LQHWSALPPVTRARVAEEAAWLAEFDSDLRAPVFALARESAGYGAVLLSWRTMRANEADVAKRIRAAPGEPGEK